MSIADLQAQDHTGHASKPACGATAAPDYHALGTFAETWVFLELFLGRCASSIGSTALSHEPSSLAAKLDALDTAIRTPALNDFSGEVGALTAEVRALAVKRQAVLQDLARASLHRLGMSLFALPDAALGPNAVPSPFGREQSIDALHLKTCDLVRRSLLLLHDLESRT